MAAKLTSASARMQTAEAALITAASKAEHAGLIDPAADPALIYAAVRKHSGAFKILDEALKLCEISETCGAFSCGVIAFSEIVSLVAICD
jgi:hypothetical protein